MPIDSTPRLALHALPEPRLLRTTLARRAAEYAWLTTLPPSDWCEEQLSGIVMSIPVGQRGAFWAIVGEME